MAAFEQLDFIRERARRVVEADRALLARRTCTAARGISAPRTAWGTTAFLQLHGGDVEEFLARLRTEYETTAVPGRFFEMPDRFRIGMGVNTEMFGEGMRRLGLALGVRDITHVGRPNLARGPLRGRLSSRLSRLKRRLRA